MDGLEAQMLLLCYARPHISSFISLSYGPFPFLPIYFSRPPSHSIFPLLLFLSSLSSLTSFLHPNLSFLSLPSTIITLPLSALFPISFTPLYFPLIAFNRSIEQFFAASSIKPSTSESGYPRPAVQDPEQSCLTLSPVKPIESVSRSQVNCLEFFVILSNK